MKATHAPALLGAALTLLLAACIPGTPVPTATPAPTASPTATFTTSTEFVSAAWLAFGANDFARARSLAQECVDRWKNEAVRQQAVLTQAPPKGTVSEADKNVILANWALNYVASAYYIIGQSAEKQAKIDEAKAAYKKVQTFPYARAWDPKGFFWVPADSASDNLTRLGP